MLSPWMREGDIVPFLKRNPNANRAQLILQIANGLWYLHTYDPVVVHGDLKCANILISETGEARLADFGLSHRAIQGASSEENSAAWYTAGNPRWQAPELLEAADYNEAERTTASDMFAFGRVIIEVYTEELPFANIPFPPAIVNLVSKGTLPARPTDPKVLSRGLDDRVWEIVKDCSQYHPHARLTARDAITRLLASPPPQPEHRLSEREPRRFFPFSLSL